MWPLFKKRSEVQPPPLNDQSTERRPLKLERLLDGMGDFSALKTHDVATKFWLPEPVALALEDFSKAQALSRSEMLRHFFAAHCYGIYIVELLRRKSPEIFRDTEPAMFSKSRQTPPPGKKREHTYWIPELGKNVSPIKIWVASRLRDDLQSLADHTEIPLSQYLREIVISRLLGHGMVPMRPTMLEATPLPSADDWCEDRDVPWRQVDETTYWNAGEGRVQSEWVDE